MSQNYSYPQSNVTQSHDSRRALNVHYSLDRNHGQTHGRRDPGQMSMGPPPPRLPMPVDPSLRDPSAPFSNPEFPVADTLTGDTSRDSRPSSSSWLPYPVNVGNGGSTAADPMVRFYNDNTEEPWTHQRVTGAGAIPINTSHQLPNKRPRVQGPNLANYPPGSKSDYGYYANNYSPSDSGYSSMITPAKSVDIPPLMENSGGIQNRAVAMEQISQMSSHLEAIYPGHVQPVYEPQSSDEDPPQLEGSQGLRCLHPDCSEKIYIAKCQSEMKKHVARHEKPFRCTEANCSRKDKGFSTINDLERHQKCVHKIQPSHGYGKFYKCFGDNCSKEEKQWPRLDNFRQHLTRMHRSQDPERLVKLSERWFDQVKKANAMRHQQQQRARLAQVGMTPASTAANQKSPRSESVAVLAGRESAPSHPDQHQSQLRHKQRSSVSFAQAANLPDEPSPIGPGSTPDHHPSTSTTRTESIPMFRQQTAQGIAQKFSGFPVQAKARSVNQPPSTSQMPQRGSKSLPGENDNAGASEFLNFTPEQNLPKNVDWDPARLTSFMTAAASLHEGEWKVLNNISNYQEFEAELAQLSGANGNSSQSSQPVLRFPATLSGQAIASDFRAGFEKMNAIVRQATRIQSQSASGPGDLATAAGPRGSVLSESGLGVSTISTRSETNRFKCTDSHCSKDFARQCELNKHLMRHKRIYACTCTGCNKTFGSKNDWVRHEESQHQGLSACWVCEELDGHGKQCAAYFQRATALQEHLRTAHNYNSEDKIQAMEKAWKMGAHGRSAFWCGFCRRRVEYEEQFCSVSSQRARFNHIEVEHFKKGQKIYYWVPPQEAAWKKLPLDPAPNDDESVSSDESRATKLSGETLVPKAATSEPSNQSTVDPRRLATKGRHHDQNLVINCCMCGDGPFDWNSHRKCPSLSCQHQVCKNCTPAPIGDFEF